MLKWYDLLPPLSETDLISYGVIMDALDLKLSDAEMEVEEEMERTMLRELEAYYSSGRYEYDDKLAVPKYKERQRGMIDRNCTKDLFWNCVDPKKLVVKQTPTKKESVDEELNN